MLYANDHQRTLTFRFVALRNGSVVTMFFWWSEESRYVLFLQAKGTKRAGILGKANVVTNNDEDDELLFMLRIELLNLVGNTNSWIMDSGATCHASCKRENFINIDEKHTEFIAVTNGKQVKGKNSC